MNSGEKDNDNNLMLSEVEQVDRLSALPNSLLVSILSLLQVNKVASTSVLSHRWRKLWTQITHFRFRCNNYRKTFRFCSIIDRFFQQHTSPKIHVFDVCISDMVSVSELGTTWLHRVCDLNVEEIRIANFCDNKLIVLPTCVFQCRSLVVLELNHRFRSELLDCDSGSVNLPKLKELRLDVRHWGFRTMLVLVKSIPSLEVLDLTINYYDGNKDYIPDSIDIPFICQNLRWLSLRIVGGWESKPIFWNHVIDAPKLETMIYLGPYWTRFNFVGNPSSLIRAKVSLYEHEPFDTSIFEDNNYLQSSGLVHVIYSVRSLQIIPERLLYLLIPLVDDGIMPSVHNLVELQIHYRYTGGGDNLLQCLHLVPNLKIFVICKSPDIRLNWGVLATVPVCLSNKLQKFEVSYPDSSNEDLKVLKYILHNANVLERLFVCTYWCFREGRPREESQFCEELFSSHRSSKSCVIEFYGRHHCASSSTNV